MERATGRSRGFWLVGLGSLILIVVALLLPRPNRPRSPGSDSTNSPSSSSAQNAARPGARRRPHGSDGLPEYTAEQIVAAKLSRFVESREKILRGMAERYQVKVAPDVERFFAALKSGQWDQVTNAIAVLQERRHSPEGGEDLNTLWPPIIETYGVAQTAHQWPAQRLLDYGDAVLGSLRPGMVYVGGTDPGRFIPTLLNETGDGGQHIVLTQNAMADNSYLKYIDYLYGGQMTTLSQEDSQGAFQSYLTDAQQRLAHDQQFPDEPKQILPGEDIQVNDGRVQVSGQVAVMGINERLLQMFMDKNSDLHFALEESFPLKSTYAQAVPLGPIMELGVQDSQNTFTTAQADQAVDYWHTTADELLADPQVSDGSDPRKAYAKMAAGQAALMADHNFPGEAEQTYRLATQLCPSSPEVVFQLVNLLVGQNRLADALPVVQNALAADPGNQQFQDLLQNLKRQQTGR